MHRVPPPTLPMAAPSTLLVAAYVGSAYLFRNGLALPPLAPRLMAGLVPMAYIAVGVHITSTYKRTRPWSSRGGGIPRRLHAGGGLVPNVALSSPHEVAIECFLGCLN